MYDKVDLLLPAQYSDSSLETVATSASLCQTIRSHHSQCRERERERVRESIL